MLLLAGTARASSCSGQVSAWTFGIVVLFYRGPEKPKRGQFRFVAMWLLCRINVARKSHTDPTNGLLTNTASACS